jgi:hypothetical protein
MANKQERRKWALEMSAALLRSDMDCFSLDEFDEDEGDKRIAAIQAIANELDAKAKRIKPAKGG